MTPLQVAVVTGGHHFDVVPFARLWKVMPGVEATVQHMDEFVGSPDPVRDAYEVVVFYTMLRDGPPETPTRGFPGNPKQALERVIFGHQGLVLLHHSILAYPDWPIWDRLVGLENRRTRAYDHEAILPIRVEDPTHPVTAGVSGWDLHDESYLLPDPHPSGRPLLTTTLATSMPTLAWARDERGKRIVCWQSGHDHHAFDDGRFRQVLRQAVEWVGSRR